MVVRYEKRGHVDLASRFLPKLQRVEGLPLEEYKKKCTEGGSGPQSVPSPSAAAGTESKDSEKARHTLFSPDRFRGHQLFQMGKDDALSAESIAQFVDRCERGEQPLYQHSHPVRDRKNCTKIVGDDFEQVVLKSEKDCVILFEDAEKGKNPEIRYLFEDLSVTEASEGVAYGRYNVINEARDNHYKK